MSLYTLAGTHRQNYMKTYENLQEIPRFLSLDSLGNLWGMPLRWRTERNFQRNPAGKFCKSCSLFGREYLAFGNGMNGYDIPRQYDDANLIGSASMGPGEAPNAVDDLFPWLLWRRPAV